MKVNGFTKCHRRSSSLSRMLGGSCFVSWALGCKVFSLFALFFLLYFLLPFADYDRDFFSFELLELLD